MLKARSRGEPNPRRRRLPNRWYVVRNKIANAAFVALKTEWESGTERTTVRAVVLARVVTALRPLRRVFLHSISDAPGLAAASLRPGAVVPSYGPVVESVEGKARGCLPELLRLELTDVLINSRCSSVLLGRNLYVERSSGPSAALGSHAAGHIVMHGAERALVRRGLEESIRSGFFLGGNGSFNYYHWLVEILPKLQFLPTSTELDALPLLVPVEVSQAPTMREALDRFAPGREVIYLDPEVTYRIAHLVYVSNINSCPFNLLPGRTYKVADFAYRAEAVEFLRRPLAVELQSASVAPHRSRRVFLARGNERRGYNEDEIIQICARRGFDVARPERLSFEAQARLFAGADFLVGPTGAAWANVVFASSGVRGLTWLPVAFREFAAYSNLARLAGGELRAMIYHGAPDSTGALYDHDYLLDPVDFERQLTALLDSE